MARRRVFRTRVKCCGIKTELGPTANQRAMVGRVVGLEKGSGSEVNLILDGAVVGCLDAPLGNEVASAIDRGQAFTAVIENAYPIYTDELKPSGAQLDIKVEYLLEKGLPAIETEKCWRCIEASDGPNVAKSFFTTVAGVTFEGRQRVVARCSIGERLALVRDPNNPFDKGAIKIMRSNGEQLGFIPSHVSRSGDSSGLAFRMDQGDQYSCRISSLTGGDGRSLGVNIEITEGEDHGESQQDVDSIKAKDKILSPLSVAPDYNKVGWLFAAAVILLLVIALIMHNRA